MTYTLSYYLRARGAKPDSDAVQRRFQQGSVADFRKAEYGEEEAQLRACRWCRHCVAPGPAKQAERVASATLAFVVKNMSDLSVFPQPLLRSPVKVDALPRTQLNTDQNRSDVFSNPLPS